MTNLRFFETIDGAGIRLAYDAQNFRNPAYETSRRDAVSYYADSFQDEVYSPCVFNLSGHKGKPRFVAGYRESCNDGYLIDLADVTDDFITAKRWADHVSEREADKAREYDDAWQAGSQWQALGDEARDYRREAMTLIRLGRRARLASHPDDAKAIARAAQLQVNNYAETRAKRADLARNNTHCADAFNAGADCAAIH